MVKGFDSSEKKKFLSAKRMAKGNVKVRRSGHFGVKISGGRKGSKPITLNIHGPLKTVVGARNRLYKKSKR